LGVSSVQQTRTSGVESVAELSDAEELVGIEDRVGRRALPAGGFSGWLRTTRRALKNEGGADVPCGDCNACCKSAYFIHIGPEETPTLSRVPEELLFPAPGLPEGHVLLGHDEKGWCPMLIDDRCSIYEHRPLTCRNYDCRVFAAARLAAGDDDKALITQRVQDWRFSYPTERDHSEHAAVRAAARFLRNRAECFPVGFVPSNPTQLAILAIKVYEVFLGNEQDSGEAGREARDLEVARAVMEASKKPDARGDVARG
jgi:hypothetical protein